MRDRLPEARGGARDQHDAWLAVIDLHDRHLPPWTAARLSAMVPS
jgi:hypothetical protein